MIYFKIVTLVAVVSIDCREIRMPIRRLLYFKLTDEGIMES